MKKKYIIELEDGVTLWGFLTDTNGEIAVTGVIKRPYTEPDLEQVRKEAYEKGYHAGYAKYLNKSFEDGLKDSWKAARKIICEMDCEDHMKIFGGDNLDYIFALSPTTAIEKLKAYERRKEAEIQVGDEVVFGNDEEIKAVVIDEADEAGVWLLLSENGCVEGMDGVLFHRTGRHFSELTEIFKKMREE